MKFYSEILNRLFDSEKELKAEEAEYIRICEEKAAEEEKTEAERLALLKEIKEARKTYNELLKKYYNEYWPW